jgi:PAS domain S-box-containing protein
LQQHEGEIDDVAVMQAPPLDAILETAHEAFVSIDEEGRICAWNREAERTFGWAREAVIGRLLRDTIIPPRYREDHQTGLHRFLRTGAGPLLNTRVEITALHRSGREIPVELTVSALETDGRWTFHAFIHDISERRRASELQARLATLVEHSADAIFSRTSEGVITSWNPAAERLYGYRAEEVLGRTVDLVPAERVEEERELVSRALRGRPAQAVDIEALRKDGRHVDVAVTISPIRDDAGRVSELVLAARDVSARKEAQRALTRAYEEERHAAELKSQLVAVASHEIRTPLTSIVGFAATLLNRWDKLSEEEKLEFLGLIESQSQRLRHLTDDVLTFSRIGAGMTVLPAPVDVTQVATEVLAELRVEDTAATGSGVANADPGHVHQILLNFVANALAYGKPPYEVGVANGTGSVSVHVADRGVGVPQEFVPQLFQAYTRALDYHEPGTRGTGLGLAIAKGLAEANGGDVWYEPNPDGGACFCLRLPSA